MKRFNYALQGRWLSASIHFTIEVSGRLAATGHLCGAFSLNYKRRLAGGQNFGYNVCMDIQTQHDKEIIQGWIFAVQLQVCITICHRLAYIFPSHQMHMQKLDRCFNN